jgi:hypothetical protein
MSNRYEREIEEILRKYDDGRPTVSERIRALNQRPQGARRGRSFNVSTESLMALGIALALVAATMRWLIAAPTAVVELSIGLLAIASFALIAGSLLYAWIRHNRTPIPMWRGQPLNQGGGAPRRTPFSSFRTRLNLLKLRTVYRRRQ